MTVVESRRLASCTVVVVGVALATLCGCSGDDALTPIAGIGGADGYRPDSARAAWSVTLIDDGPLGPERCAVQGHTTKVGDVNDTTSSSLVTNGDGTSALGVTASVPIGLTTMPRIPDFQRIERLLQNASGSLGRREIIEELGLSDDRYQQVADDLVAKKIAVKNRGRAGGLRLFDASAPAPAKDEQRKPVKPPLEAELYQPFAKYFERAARGDESKSVVLTTHETKLGKWETPDLTEVRVTPFPMVGQWELWVATYELKRQGAWSVDSVLQTATYAEFSHESWLVVPSADVDNWVEHFGNRVVDKAGDFGIGLATFDEGAKTLKKHMKPRRNQPTLSRLHEWLDSVIERLDNGAARTSIANNVRWARGKAEAGKD